MPGIHIASIGEDLVVLDTGSDAYACLVGGGDHLRLLGDGRIAVSHRQVLMDLVATEWLTSSAEPPASRTASKPLQSRPVIAGASLKDVIRVGIATHVSAALFRRQSLAQLVDTAHRLRRRSGPSAPVDPIIVDRTVVAFLKLRPWLPDQGLCLQRSFSLLQCLSRRGIVADWVFGVRTWPFAAHCWLQIGDEVIGDDLDRISAYAPILVV